jgi:Fibronectin type III domain/Domain of Unknown Function (DUF1080)
MPHSHRGHHPFPPGSLTVPGAPTIGTASGGNTQATVTWTAPASNGGTAVTGYTVTPYIGATAQPSTTVGNVLTATVTGLANGTAYTFKVAAVNAVGTGPQSAASNGATPGVTFTEDWTGYTVNTQWAQGTTHGPWTVAFDGGGTTGVYNTTAPEMTTEPSLTETTPSSPLTSSMVYGPTYTGDLTITAEVKTVSEGAQPWQAAWITWHNTGTAPNSEFYYFLPKSNGYELGKADTAYPGNQRFLATGSPPNYPVGVWRTYTIVQTGNQITVSDSVNGTVVVFTDTERPYTTGKIGLYSEGSSIIYGNITVTQ